MPIMTLLLDRKPVRVYETSRAVIRIGRGEDMDISIDNLSVSREQAEIRHEGNVWTVRDLGSSNGTFLNGQRVTAPQPLRPGDEVAFGKFAILFERELTDVPAPGPAASHPAAPAEGTLALAPEEAERLLQAAALKRRAQLQWEAGRRRGTHFIEGGAALIGRSGLCDLRVSAGGPSPYVALVVRGAAGFEVRNLSRFSRLRLNGQATVRAALENGDTIRIGRLRLTFLDEVR